MEYVQEFIKVLCESDVLKDYNRIRVYLDEDYNSAEHFTVRINRLCVYEMEIDSLLENIRSLQSKKETRKRHRRDCACVTSFKTQKFDEIFLSKDNSCKSD